MNRTLEQCLDFFDKTLYQISPKFSDYTRNKVKKSGNNCFILIKHLSIIDFQGLKLLLNEIIDLSLNDDILLVHSGLINMLTKKYPTQTINFIKTERARKFITSYIGEED